MYKAQFVKWDWNKYSTGCRARRNGPESDPAKRRKKKGTPRAFLAESLRQNASSRARLQLQLLETDESRNLTCTMSAYRNFILSWSAQDPRWRTATPFTKMGQYNPVMISHFLGALLQFRQREFEHGGRLLRAAFLELDDLIADGHVAAVWDCCVAAPKLAIDHGCRDILITFLRYLSQLCSARAPRHPLAHISRSILAFIEYSGSPDHVTAYTTVAWRLWTDIMVSLLGPDNISTLHTHRAYLVIQAAPDPALVLRVAQDYDRLVEKAVAELGSDNTTSLSLEFDALLTRSRFNMSDPGSAVRAVGGYPAKIEC